MGNIDWSKAPAGATHYHAHNKGFYRFSKGDSGFYGFGGFEPTGKRIDSFPVGTLVERNYFWDGDGLPEKGEKCEWKEKTGFQWVEATVLFITESSVVLQRSDGFEWQMMTKRTVFRPIRSIEQIKAEEKEKMVAEMEADIARWGLTSDYNGMCQALYDAGYRKQDNAERAK